MDTYAKHSWCQKQFLLFAFLVLDFFIFIFVPFAEQVPYLPQGQNQSVIRCIENANSPTMKQGAVDEMHILS